MNEHEKYIYRVGIEKGISIARDTYLKTTIIGFIVGAIIWYLLPIVPSLTPFRIPLLYCDLLISLWIAPSIMLSNIQEGW